MALNCSRRSLAAVGDEPAADIFRRWQAPASTTGLWLYPVSNIFPIWRNLAGPTGIAGVGDGCRGPLTRADIRSWWASHIYHRLARPPAFLGNENLPPR